MKTNILENIAENIIEALHEIWTHKMRSFLTMLGVIIGIAAIIAIVSTIKGTNDQIMEELVGKGNNNVSIKLMQGSDDYYMDGTTPPQGILGLSSDQKKRIRDIDNVDDASFYHVRNYVENISRGEKLLSSGKVMGIDLNFLHTYGYVVYNGRFFVKKDMKDFHKVALLDASAAEVLFADTEPVGKTIEIGGEPFVVVGLYQQRKAFSPEIHNLDEYMTYYQDSGGTVLIPDSCWPTVFGYDEPLNAYVRASKTEYMSEVGKKAQEIMRESVTKQAGKVTYTAEDMMEEAKNKQKLETSTNNLLIWVASIALLVGGIGVMNIMLVSVTERTREIGLKRSLGAKKRRILMQFLTESAVLTSLGGIFGVIVGLILSEVISRVTKIATAISVPAIIVGVAFSMGIGLIFGLLPSIKAANLSPIEALRRE